MEPITPAPREFAETGWSKQPVELETKRLTLRAHRVYCHLAWIADHGGDPPTTMPEIRGITEIEWELALDELAMKGMLIRASATDWTLTDSSEWL